jgi:peroxiredoxin
VRIVGVGFTGPEANAAWGARMGYTYALWSDSERVLATHYDAVAPWDDTAPLRHAYILDANGSAVVRHEGGVSLGADPASVLEDCAALFGDGASAR